MPSNVKYYHPNRIYSKEHRPQKEAPRRSSENRKQNILLHLIERAQPSNRLGIFKYENQEALRRSFEKYNILNDSRPEKDRRGAVTLFDLKDAKVIRGGLSIKCNMIVFFDRVPRRLVSCDVY